MRRSYDKEMMDLTGNSPDLLAEDLRNLRILNGKLDKPAVAKLGTRLWNRTPVFLISLEKRIKGDLSQRQDDPDILEELQLLYEIGAASLELISRRFVRRRRAAHRRGNVTVLEPETVVAAHGIGLVGEAELIEGFIEPVAALIAGEYSSGPVSAIGRRRQTDDQKSGLGIAESGDRPRPVGLPEIPARRLLRYRCAPAHQAGTLLTADNGCIEILDVNHAVFLLAKYGKEDQRRKAGDGPDGH